MHNFKKMLTSVVVTVLLIALVSWVIIVPYINSEFFYFQDRKLRESLAGEIDAIVLGASHGMNGFDTGVLDTKLDCSSYNLSASMMTLDSRYYLLEKELKRNPVKTVILELAFDTLLRNEPEEFGSGDELTIARLDSFGERLRYMLQHVKVDNWLNIYSRQMVAGLNRYQEILSGGASNSVDYEAKGYYPMQTVDVTLSAIQAPKTFNTREISTDYREENIEKFNAVVELCKSYDVRIIVTVVPVSDKMIWESEGWDDFNHWLIAYCEERDCEFYDMNLIKNRYELFDDSVSYADEDHLSEDGAQAFTEAFCEIINKVDAAEEVSECFYSSYEEMKQYSPYKQ